MTAIKIVTIIFLIMEVLNVLTLYFKPDTSLGNGIGIFKDYKEARKDENMGLFVSYLINWVAGTKLIFISLLVVILIFGNETTKLAAAGVMVLSILSFFWRLFPIVRKLDQKGRITPEGYSKGLGLMITGMILMFLVAFIIASF